MRGKAAIMPIEAGGKRNGGIEKGQTNGTAKQREARNLERDTDNSLGCTRRLANSKARANMKGRGGRGSDNEQRYVDLNGRRETDRPQCRGLKIDVQ